MNRQASARASAWLGILLALLTFAPVAEATENGSAVVLMYHRVGEEARADTSVSLAQFGAHLSEIAAGGYAVLPLTQIVRRLRGGPPLPERTLGLSFDDGWLSTYRDAWPRLRAAGLPFALFIATDHFDRNLEAYMGWPALREMASSALVEIGVQGSAHAHLAEASPAAARADIANAVGRVTAELGAPPPLFSYPYGEYGTALRDLVADMDFVAAFGQHSGAFDAGDDRYALPRFAMSFGQGGLDRFRLVAGALPLAVRDPAPADPLLTPESNPPRYRFTVSAGEAAAAAVNCYVNGAPATLARPGSGQIAVLLEKPFPPGRHRINCTQPAPDRRWYWRGALFTVPR